MATVQIHTNRLLLFAMMLCVASCVRERSATVIKTTGVYGTYDDAARVGSLNRTQPVTQINLVPGTKIVVVSDTYGKDYWACKIRLESGVEGWVLCNSLDYTTSRAGV